MTYIYKWWTSDEEALKLSTAYVRLGFQAPRDPESKEFAVLQNLTAVKSVG